MRRHRSRSAKDGGGFTLVEVLVAALILGVSLVAITTAFPVSYLDISYSGRVSQAAALAQATLENVKMTVAAPGGYPPGTTSGTVTATPYTITWSMASVGYGAASADLRRVEVTVTWPQIIRTGRFDLVGYISRPY